MSDCHVEAIMLAVRAVRHQIIRDGVDPFPPMRVTVPHVWVYCDCWGRRVDAWAQAPSEAAVIPETVYGVPLSFSPDRYDFHIEVGVRRR